MYYLPGDKGLPSTPLLTQRHNSFVLRTAKHSGLQSGPQIYQPDHYRVRLSHRQQAFATREFRGGMQQTPNKHQNTQFDNSSKTKISVPGLGGATADAYVSTKAVSVVLGVCSNMCC